MFNSIIDEAAGRFDLGDKAGTLLSALLAMITDKGRGGFAGLLDRFRAVGLGDTAESWINSGVNTPLSYEQLESAFGEETLKNLSGQVGLEYKKTVSASAFMLPRIIDQLTPDGRIPSENDLLSRIGGYLTDDAGLTPVESFDRMGTAAVAGQTNAPSVGSHVEDLVDYQTEEENTILNWLLPLVLLAFLIVVGYMFCGGKPAAPVAFTNVNSRNLNANQ
jgi:uncharacterized protein YidB (DUF937 family)